MAQVGIEIGMYSDLVFPIFNNVRSKEEDTKTPVAARMESLIEKLQRTLSPVGTSPVEGAVLRIYYLSSLLHEEEIIKGEVIFYLERKLTRSYFGIHSIGDTWCGAATIEFGSHERVELLGRKAAAGAA